MYSPVRQSPAVKDLAGYFESMHGPLQLLAICLSPLWPFSLPVSFFLPDCCLIPPDQPPFLCSSAFASPCNPFLPIFPGPSIYSPRSEQLRQWKAETPLSAPPLCDFRAAQPTIVTGFCSITNFLVHVNVGWRDSWNSKLQNWNSLTQPELKKDYG